MLSNRRAGLVQLVRSSPTEHQVLGSKQPPCIFAGVRLASVTPSPEPHSSGSRLALGLPFFLKLGAMCDPGFAWAQGVLVYFRPSWLCSSGLLLVCFLRLGCLGLVSELQLKWTLFQLGKAWFAFTCLILVCFLMNNALHVEILALKVLPMWKYSICFFMIYHIDNGILWVCEFRTISLEHSSHHVTSRLHSLMRGPGSRYSAYILMLLQLGFTPEFCL